MSRYSNIIIWTMERDLLEESRKEPLNEHLKTEYKRDINQYFEQTL